jgi:hypothetical protein
MIKFFQLLYGHLLITSILLLITKVFLNLGYFQNTIFILIVFIIFQVRPHPTEQKYLFAFEIRPLFLR